jgi:hypothetical protein
MKAFQIQKKFGTDRVRFTYTSMHLWLYALKSHTLQYLF